MLLLFIFFALVPIIQAVVLDSANYRFAECVAARAAVFKTVSFILSILVHNGGFGGTEICGRSDSPDHCYGTAQGEREDGAAHRGRCRCGADCRSCRRFRLVRHAVAFLAVPLLIGAAVAIDALIALYVRQTYLLLTGQAICTEVAARASGEADARQRRKQALSDLAEIQKDVEKAVDGEREEEQELLPAVADAQGYPPVTPPPEEAKPAAHRRRRQAVFTVIQSDKTGSVRRYDFHRISAFCIWLPACR